MTDLRFPIGEFDLTGELTADQRTEAIHRIESAPAELLQAVEGLTEALIGENHSAFDPWRGCRRAGGAPRVYSPA